MIYEKAPLILSSSQYTQHKEADLHLDPLRLMIRVGEEVIKKTGGEEIKDFIEAIYMININSWSYKDAPQKLADALDLHPQEKIYLSDGGNTPQMIVNRACKKISLDKLKGVLVIGGEASYSLRKARKGKVEKEWPPREKPAYMEGKIWQGITSFENTYKLFSPPITYAIFESAVMNTTERSVEEHRAYLGKLFQHFSKIAATNPYSWSQEAYTAEEIITPSKTNRMVSFPYTKRMCSNMFVDQSAAILLTNDGIAQQLGINSSQRVYVMGGCDLKNVHEITMRPNLFSSPASYEGSRLALKQAGLQLEEIDAFDLYSCFPSIVEILQKEIGISKNDPRDMTLTGGLPYFGGPWSNYSLHAIATAVDKIQHNSHLTLMVVANGGYNNKQSFGIYGTRPPKLPWGTQENPEIQEKILKDSLKTPIEKANGLLTVEGYTITYDRNQTPLEGIIIGKIKKNRRTIAYIKADPDRLVALEHINPIGKQFLVSYDKELKYNLVDFTN